MNLTSSTQPALFNIEPEKQKPAAKPVLKWAGGKGQLINQINEYLPIELKEGKIKKYAEPFIGGGALFFHIVHNYPCIEEFYISDVNEELVLLYKTIQTKPDDLIDYLNKLQNKYFNIEPSNQREFFNEIREKFNKLKPEFNYKRFSSSWVERAADIIFLNRTCFNGLFRVNSKGLFNVPFGSYNNPTICDEFNLINVSKALHRAKIEHADYSKSDSFIDNNTFAYFDPPYRPLSKTASFNSYVKGPFADKEQEELAAYFRYLDSKNGYLMLSNSDPKNSDEEDDFFDKLYFDFTIHRVRASRMINSNSEKRGQISEILVINYEQNRNHT